MRSLPDEGQQKRIVHYLQNMTKNYLQHVQLTCKKHDIII